MNELRLKYPVRMMRRIMNVSASGYYAWVDRPLSKRAQEEVRLELEIMAAHQRNRQTYGPERLQGNGPNLGGSPAAPMEYDEVLFEELRVLRRRLADVRDVPAFVIFGDVSLRHMAAAFPRSMEESSRIHGVGEVKLEQYGPEFLEGIRGYFEVNGLPDRTGASVNVNSREKYLESETGRRVAGKRLTMKPNRCWSKDCPSARLPSNEVWRKLPSSATWNA